MYSHEPVQAESCEPCDLRSADTTAAPPSRRSFLLLGISALIAGCATAPTQTALPGPVWRPRALPEPPLPGPGGDALTGSSGVILRTRWSSAPPAPALMNRMLPVQHITVHHDGMDPFFAADDKSSGGRLEAIRRAHRDRGWGDIGYHFAVDREGRVWECRPLAWQGAHVKDHNEGNIGVLAMGNFDRQAPTSAQLQALNRFVSSLMRRHRVPSARLHTHQEWPSAATACPGVNLQRYMVAARSNGQFG